MLCILLTHLYVPVLNNSNNYYSPCFFLPNMHWVGLILLFRSKAIFAVVRQALQSPMRIRIFPPLGMKLERTVFPQDGLTLSTIRIIIIKPGSGCKIFTCVCDFCKMLLNF